MVKLIVGCGYLGSRVARLWLQDGHEVWALTRSPGRAERLAADGLRPIVGDVTDPRLDFPLRHVDAVLWAVGYDRSAGRAMRDVYVEGLQRGLDLLPASTGRFLYVSSTGVYGPSAGDWVDERSACEPTREGGRVCLAAESRLQEHPLGRRAVILRLAGIYGPGRIPRRADIEAGRPLAVPSEGYLNLVHVEDAARIVLAAEQHAPLPSLYVVSDGHPVPRADYYRYLAELLGAPDPKFIPPDPEDPASRRAAADKRIRNDRLRAELPVTWQFPSYRAGLADALRQPG